MKRFVTALLMAAAISTPAVAAAANSNTNQTKPGGGGATSAYDVSYPQCGTKLPTGQPFGIVGLNGGLANNQNSCYAAQLAWAQGSKGGTGQPKAAVYVDTANPGDVTPKVASWPSSGSNFYGTCTGADTAACAYEYGKARATQDVTWAGSGSFTWWLDVESINSWSNDTMANAADLEGMTEYFKSQGGSVGVYSTTMQWNQVVGTYIGDGSLNGLSEWGAGASTLADAQSNCHVTPFIMGGTMSVMQYVPRGAKIDSDWSCL